MASMNDWWLAAIAKAKTAKECREFEKEVGDRPELLKACRLREAQLMKVVKGVPLPQTDFEWRIFNDMRSVMCLGRVTLIRTWQMIGRHGYLDTVAMTVKKYHKTATVDKSCGFAVALTFGRLDLTFEQAVLDYPDLFSKEVRAIAQRTMANARRRK